MTLWTLIGRSLRFHARAHLGVLLGAAIGTMALAGALIVGDSVRQTLRERALARLGPAPFALQSGERFFLSDLRQRLDQARASRGLQTRNTTPSGGPAPLWLRTNDVGKP